MAKKPTDVWKTNFASNPKIRDAVKAVLLPKIKAVKNQRIHLDDDWIRFYNMWNVEHDDSHQYMGRAKLYIPEVRKNVEAQARQFTDLAFPSDNFLNCYPGAGGTTRGAEAQRSMRLWQINQANLKQKFFLFARQQCLYGTSPSYVCWNKKVEHAFQSARDPRTGKIKPSRKLIEQFNGPDFMVRDLFKWYALNPRKSDLEDGTVEYRVVDRFEIERRTKEGMVYASEEIFKGNSDAYLKSELQREVEKAETLGLLVDGQTSYAGSASLTEDHNEKSGTHLLATIFLKLVCPEACLDDENPDLGIPMQVDIYDDEHIGFVGRNPFWHQRPPYLVGRYIYPNPDEFYGQGIAKATQYQQYEMNSKAEQAMDCATLALNPIAFIDPALAAQVNNFEIEPNAIWYVSPNAVRFSEFPDVTQTGYMAINQLRSQMQDYSDRQPSLPSQFSGKARTATQSEIVNQSMSVDFKHFQRQNEMDVLNPLMDMWESLTDQNIDEEQIIMILGRTSEDYKRTVWDKEFCLGSYKYIWSVSTDPSNKQIKARQLLDAMKIAGTLPPEAQQKLGFNFAEAFRIMWKEILQLPNSDRVIPDPLAQPVQDPEVVYRMMKLGMETEVLAADDNAKMIEYFAAKLPEEKSQTTQAQMVAFIMEHKQMLEHKKAIAQQMIEQQKNEIMAQQQQAQQGQEQQGAQEGSGAQGSGNRMQTRTNMNPNASVGSMASGTRP